MLAVHHGDGLAPIALAAEHPIAQLKIGFGLANALFHQPLRDGLFCLFHAHAVQKAAVHHHAGGAICKGSLLHIAALHHFHNVTAELLGKFPVALIVRGHSHNGACAVADQHIIGNENGNLFAVHRVHGAHALYFHARFLFGQLGALEIAFAGGLFLVGAHGGHVANFICPFFNGRVLGADDHIGGAKQRVRPGGVNQQAVARRGFKPHLCAVAAANPVLLLGLYAVNKIQPVQIVYQPVGIGGYFQHPLAFVFVHHIAAAALALAVHHFFVGKHHLAARAPVDVHLFFIGKALFIKLKENPLRPLVIRGVGGVHFPVPIEREPQAFQLAFEARHVLFGDKLGVDVVFHGIVFRGQAKGVPAHGVQHVIALQALFARHNVQRGIAARVPHVQALAGGVWELYQGVIFGQRKILFGGKRFLFIPDVLPLFFNCLEIVLHALFHIQ